MKEETPLNFNFIMDGNMRAFFILLLVAFGLLAPTDAQYGRMGRGYGMRRFIAPRPFYPRYPGGHGHLVDPFSRRSVFGSGIIGDPYSDPYIGDGVLPYAGGVYPTGGVVTGLVGDGRRPAVIENQSSDRVEHINIHNNNNNQRIQTGSNNVAVNQVIGGSGNQCQPCPADGYCPGGRSCQYSQSCPNEIVCV